MRMVKLAIGLAAVSILLTGCVVVPVSRPYYDADVVIVEPPPPRIEYMGYPPAVGYIWIDGYWGWTGHRHRWVPGRWEAPRPGYRWVPHRWHRDGKHWRQHGGSWEQDRRSHGEFEPRHERETVRRHDHDPGPRHEQREQRGSFVPGAAAPTPRESRPAMEREVRRERVQERSLRPEQSVRPNREQEGRRGERREAQERKGRQEQQERRNRHDRDETP